MVNSVTDERTCERKDENYIPIGINAGGLKSDLLILCYSLPFGRNQEAYYTILLISILLLLLLMRAYKQTSEDHTKKTTNKINRTVNDLFKRGVIDSELKHYMDRVKRIWYL